MPIVGSNGIEIYYEDFGDPTDPTLLMISGLGAHSVGYNPELCYAFVDRGLHVIRYDNRDVGFSTHLHDDPGYTLVDMANDGLGLLDAIGVDTFHAWGCSMGGMIAQTMAIAAPDRVLTLTSIMSTTGEASVGGADPEILDELLANATPPIDADDFVAKAMAGARLFGSVPEIFDEAEHLRRNTEMSVRNFDSLGQNRQLMAVFASDSRAESLRALSVPTLVIHGTADKLLNISGGRHTAECIPGAQFIELEGMGHDLPSPLWPQIVEATIGLIAANAG